MSSTNRLLFSVIPLLCLGELFVACREEPNPPRAPLPSGDGNGGGVWQGMGGQLHGGGAGGFGGDGPTVVDGPVPCSTEACGPRRECVEGDEGAFCQCLPGFAGQRCEDIDECAVVSSCGAHEICRNYPGGFACTCAPGFTFEHGECVDTNECAGESGPCSSSATCENTSGDFQCTCAAGDVGDGFFCKAEGSCDEDPCSGSGTCVETPTGHACQCNLGYAGHTDCATVCEDLELPLPLEEWVRLIVGKPKGTLVPEDVSAIESLNARSLGLTELGGLECFPQLRQLDVAANLLESDDLAVIGQLNRLESLRLDCNPIEDLSALENHPTLEHLWFAQSGPDCEASLENIAALASLRRLRSLDLSGHELSDLGALVELDALRTLALSHNALGAKELEALGELTTLETLVLRSNPLGDVDFVQKMASLKVLDLSMTNVVDLSPLSATPSLETLAGAQLGLDDVSALPVLERLVELDLSENELENVSPLVPLSRVRFLDLRRNELKSLGPFREMSELGILLVDDNPVLCDDVLKNDAGQDFEFLVQSGIWLGATCSEGM